MALVADSPHDKTKRTPAFWWQMPHAKQPLCRTCGIMCLVTHTEGAVQYRRCPKCGSRKKTFRD